MQEQVLSETHFSMTNLLLIKTSKNSLSSSYVQIHDEKSKARSSTTLHYLFFVKKTRHVSFFQLEFYMANVVNLLAALS